MYGLTELRPLVDVSEFRFFAQYFEKEWTEFN